MNNVELCDKTCPMDLRFKCLLSSVTNRITILCTMHCRSTRIRHAYYARIKIF